MNTKTIKKLIREQKINIDIKPMSQALINTPIFARDNDDGVVIKNSNKTLSLMAVISPIIIISIVFTFIFSLNLIGFKSDFSIYYFSYNPEYMITVNADDEIVSVNTLNDDAEELVSSLDNPVGVNIYNYIDNLINISFDRNYLKPNHSQVFNIRVINSDERFADENSNKLANFVEERFALKEKGIQISSKSDSIDDMKNKFNIKDMSKNLDHLMPEFQKVGIPHNKPNIKPETSPGGDKIPPELIDKQ